MMRSARLRNAVSSMVAQAAGWPLLTRPRAGWRVVLRRLICYSMCLISWRGPLPCLHEHEVGPQVAHATVLRHCQAFHANSVEPSYAGWHLHLVSPWCGPETPAGGDGPDSPASCATDPLTAGRALLEAAGWDNLATELSDWQWLGPSLGNAAEVAWVGMARLAALVPGARPPHYATSLLASAPLCAIFCLARC